MAIARGRRSSPLGGLAAATLILSLADPWVVRNTGFQLSTAATAAILLLCRPPVRHRGIGGIAAASFWVSGAAALGIAPVLAAGAHRLTPISLLLNPLAVPAMGVSLIGAIAALAADASGAARIAQALAAAVAGVLETLLQLSAAVDGRVRATPIPAPAVPWVLPLCLALGGALLLWRAAESSTMPLRPVTARALSLATCGLVAAGFAAAVRVSPMPPAEAFRLVALDIGQGDALLVETNSTSTLIDTGGSLLGSFDPGMSIVAPALRARGIRRLDAVAITHLHADHAGGLDGLLQEIPADVIWVSSFDPGAAAGAQLRDAAGRTPIVSLAARRRLRGERCDWRVLHPGPEDLPAGGAAVSNDGSLVLLLTCEGRSVLLTGDTGARAEAAYLDFLRAHEDVLKSAHHGSDTSSSVALLEAAGSRHAVISAGWRNRFGLPDAEVLERYRSRGIAVYRTDRDGAVTLSAGRRIRVRAERWSAGRGPYRVGGWLD